MRRLESGGCRILLLTQPNQSWTDWSGHPCDDPVRPAEPALQLGYRGSWRNIRRDALTAQLLSSSELSNDVSNTDSRLFFSQRI